MGQMRKASINMNEDCLKFRVWDKVAKRYIQSEEWCINCFGVLHFQSEFLGDDIPRNEDDYIIEQCTGLKDLNGKLIYQGDVVVQRNEYPYYDYADGVEHKSLNETLCIIEHDAVLNYIGIVEWADEDAQFLIVLQCVNPSKNGISTGCCHYFSDDLATLEVIGNIHEPKWGIESEVKG